jgi:hypothetical protein
LSSTDTPLLLIALRRPHTLSQVIGQVEEGIILGDDIQQPTAFPFCPNLLAPRA